MSDRIITVVLKIKEPEKAESIWKCHINNELLSGCEVDAIANGNLINKIDELEDELIEKDKELEE